MLRFFTLLSLFVLGATSCLIASPPCIKDLKDIAEQCTFCVRYESDGSETPSGSAVPTSSEPKKSAILMVELWEFFDEQAELHSVDVEWNAKNLPKDDGYSRIQRTPDDTIESVFLDMLNLAEAKYGSIEGLKKCFSLCMKASALPFENESHRAAMHRQWSRFEMIGMIHISHSHHTRLHRDQAIFKNFESPISVTLELENFGVIPHPTPSDQAFSNPLIGKITLQNTRIPFFALGHPSDCPVMCEFAGTHGQGWHDHFSKGSSIWASHDKLIDFYTNEDGTTITYPIAFFEDRQNHWKLKHYQNYGVEINYMPYAFLNFSSPLYSSELAYPHTLIRDKNYFGLQRSKLVGLLTCLKQLFDEKDLKKDNWRRVRSRFEQAQLPMDDDVAAKNLLSPDYLHLLCRPTILTLCFEDLEGNTVETLLLE